MLDAQLLLPLFVAAAFWGIVFGGICYFVAEEKGRDGLLWMGLGALGGFVALIALAAVPAVPKRNGVPVAPRVCAGCATPTGNADRFCRQCGAAVTA